MTEPAPPTDPPPAEPPEVTAAPDPPTARRPAAVGCLIEVAQTLALTLVIFFAIQTFIAQPFEVKQRSMEQTLEQGHYVLVDKLTPRWDPYKRGDIVVFHPPSTLAGSDATPFVKRVIAVGGQTVEIRDGQVLVDGVALVEPYLYAVDGVAEPTITTTNPPRWVIPEGELFLLGDHRMGSQDSRVIGPVEVSEVIGRAWLRYWPIDRFGILANGQSATPAVSPSP